MQGLARGGFAQTNEGVIVAGIQREQVHLGVKGHGKCALNFCHERFNRRCQAGLGLAFGPEQLAGKFGELGRHAFFPNDEVLVQALLPLFELTPHMAVRHAQ